MPDPQFNLANYGPAGGQLQSRFLVTVDPREAIPIAAAGPMYSTRPAHKLGLSGSAYRYGPTVVGGLTNLVPIDGAVVSIPLVGTTSYLANFRNVVADFSPNIFYDNTSLGNAYYGGMISTGASESFSSPGTVGLAGNTVTGVGTSFLSDTVGGYAYTPSFKNPRAGDFITIAGNDYLILSIASNTSMTVYPSGNVGAGAGYTIKRYGFASNSRIISITTAAYTYFVCNTYSQFIAGDLTHPYAGTLCAIGGNFKTGPQNVSNQDILTDDIAYYKGFLFYATNSAISWSLVGFPNTIPFAQSDFPAINTTVVDNTDKFVSFEYLGDQLVALFENSIWLVVPTGTIPEFNFYKLPENRGANVRSFSAINAGGTLFKIFGRTTCSAPGAIYYLNKAGVFEFNGSLGRSISDPINDLISGGNATSLQWEPNTDSIIVNTTSGSVPTGPSATVYYRKSGTWGLFDIHTLGTNIAPKRTVFPLGIDDWAYTITGSGQIQTISDVTIGGDSDPTGSALPWSWSTPIINLSDVYNKFQFGGFIIDAHGDNAHGTPSLNWTVYAGTSPYNMVIEDSGTYNYLSGTISARDMLSKKIDKPFVGIVLSGSNYIKLAGVLIYDARTTARR